MSANLQYVYAGYNVNSGLCEAVVTTSYEINMDGWVLVPEFTYDYKGKYYNRIDGLWYLTSDFSQIWADAPQW